jgi:hypothetical protein
VSDERAETYLRLRAEVELRQAADQLRGLDAAVRPDDRGDPGMAPFATAEGAQWKVIRAGRILVAAGALEEDFLARLVADLDGAIRARSRIMLNWDRRRGMLHHTMSFTPDSGPAPPSGPRDWAMRVVPLGRALRVPSDHGPAVLARGPSALHLMSLVGTGSEAVITAALRMPWPRDRTAGEGTITRAGPRVLPYDQFWAVDEHGTRYAARFESGKGRAGTCPGIVRLSPMPPADVRRLDLVGDGTHLIRLALGSSARGRQAVRWPAEPVPIAPGERLLVLEAERILASGDARGPAQGPIPGEIITVLTETGAIAPDSPVPGQLAALCRRLGAAGHGITIPPAAQIPAPWASVIAHRDAPALADGPEVFAPLACVLPDVDGAQFALAGLSTAESESYLHVVGKGMAPLADRFAWNWTPGFSWWLRDGTGNWHVAAAGEPHTLGDDIQAFRLRLVPPLAAVPDTAEVVVTGPATQVRATVPMRPARETSTTATDRRPGRSRRR